MENKIILLEPLKLSKLSFGREQLTFPSFNQEHNLVISKKKAFTDDLMQSVNVATDFAYGFGARVCWTTMELCGYVNISLSLVKEMRC